jgi:NAD(P)-dependent dehydrogenase (short-subunit alcohol dehydrogenase family)
MTLGVVVTGGGAGIGRAISERLAAEGYKVVVNDVNEAAARQVAKEIGGFAVPGDASSERGAEALHAAARHALGDIDIWFANAGIDRGRGLNVSEQDWGDSIEVNLMAHVRAARLLVPEWLRRGRGRFVVTASAAGLLTMLDAPSYSVTKHGAVAFAEWLSATYRHRGIVVQAVCPQGVNTDMLMGSGSLVLAQAKESALEPAQIADCVWEALKGDQFLVLPHPEVADYAARRGADHDRWLRGINRLQQKLEQDVATS